METTNIKKFENRTRNAIRLLAFLEAKEGKETELERTLLDLIPPTLKETGNIAYVPHKSIENPRAFMFDELWENEKAIEEHFKQPHMINLIEKLNPLLARPLELKRYHEVVL
ncbi:MAG TPA: putative quinol monooxygenase [Nitrososphaeraceae archaeon]|nr:putative quinol monooxygenase [Nitrososphaeraceae archaeon]